MFVSSQIWLTIIQMTNAVDTIVDVLGVFIVIKFQNIRQLWPYSAKHVCFSVFFS